ncbi:MAG: hypothetical protein ACKOK8_05195, partial [Planctomycetia bacterium]
MENIRHFAAAWSDFASGRNRAVAVALVALLTGLLIAVVPARGQEPITYPQPAATPADITPPWGTFPQAGAGIELAGELAAVDRRIAARPSARVV